MSDRRDLKRGLVDGTRAHRDATIVDSLHEDLTDPEIDDYYVYGAYITCVLMRDEWEGPIPTSPISE